MMGVNRIEKSSRMERGSPQRGTIRSSCDLRAGGLDGSLLLEMIDFARTAPVQFIYGLRDI
jgi:hypothetical protein